MADGKHPPGFDKYMDNWQLTDEEVAAANKLLDRFFAQMMEVFGTRLDVVMANLLGEKLAHMLAEPAKIDGVPFGMFVQATVNDWLRTGHREHDRPPLQLSMAGEDHE